MEGSDGARRRKLRALLFVATFLLGGLTGVVLDRTGVLAPRYVLINAGQGRVYRLDKSTGEVWWISQNQAASVEFKNPASTPVPLGLLDDDRFEQIENSALGVSLVGHRAAGFEVIANAGETLRLVRPAQGQEAEAMLIYEASPPQAAGVNLVEAVNEQKAAIEARPDGNFLGQVQLMSEVLGNAYSTRGRYTGSGGEEIEEVKLFAVHPSGDRLLSVTYRYRPAEGGSKARLDQAMAALGLIEPLMPEAEPEGGEPAPGE